jgi:hypothetical protein
VCGFSTYSAKKCDVCIHLFLYSKFLVYTYIKVCCGGVRFAITPRPLTTGSLLPVVKLASTTLDHFTNDPISLTPSFVQHDSFRRARSNARSAAGTIELSLTITSASYLWEKRGQVVLEFLSFGL